MAAQFTLRIPAHLEKDFDQYKGNFNVSSICQAAIEKEIEYHKLLASVLSDRDKLVARLRKEKRDLEDEAFQAGRAEGVKDASNFDYQSIKIIVRSVDEDWAADEIIKHFQDLGDDTGDNLLEWAKEFGYEIQFDSLIRGWCAGIADVWSEIEDEVEREWPRAV